MSTQSDLSVSHIEATFLDTRNTLDKLIAILERSSCMLQTVRLSRCTFRNVAPLWLLDTAVASFFQNIPVSWEYTITVHGKLYMYRKALYVYSFDLLRVQITVNKLRERVTNV